MFVAMMVVSRLQMFLKCVLVLMGSAESVDRSITAGLDGVRIKREKPKMERAQWIDERT